MSILPETALLQDLNVDVVTSSKTGAQGGFAPNAIIAKGKTPSTYKPVNNTIYTATLHEYVTVGSQKWATMNVGASSPTDYDDYFAWG